MGSTISTSLVADGDRFLPLFRGVLNRILERSERATNLRVIRYLHSGVSGDDVERYELTETECLALARQIDNTPWAMNVEVPYIHSNGMGDSVDLVFRGSEFRPDMIQRWGRLQIKCSEVVQLASKTTANFTPVEPNESAIEAFFSRICGLSVSEKCDGNVLHGYMYSEAGWLYPATCHAVYHLHAREFLVDFGRCRHFFKHSLPMGLMTLPSFNFRHIHVDAISLHENVSDVSEYLPDCAPGKPQRLCEDFIREVVEHAGDLIEATEEAALDYVSHFDQHRNEAFRFHSFTNGGEVVIATPPEELWRFYLQLWALIRQT